MELDQLKNYWQTEQESQVNNQILNKEKLELLMNSIESNLQVVQKKNEQWYKLTINLNKVVALVWIALLVIYLALPNTKSHISLPLLGHLFWVMLIAATAIWSMKRQKEIFDVADGDSIAETMQRITTEFKRFYTVMNLRFFGLLPVYFYMLLAYPTGGSRTHGGYVKITDYIDMAMHGVTMKVLFCLGATLIVFALNHWYYHKTYFKRVAQMQQSLDELSAAGE